MTRALKPRGSGGIGFPQTLPTPTALQPDLEAAVDVCLNPLEEEDSRGYRHTRYLPEGWRGLLREAKEIHLAVGAALEAPPITAEMLMVWLTLIGAGTKNKPSDDALREFCDLLTFALDGVPSSVLAADVLKEGLRRWKWFPSAGQVMTLLESIVAAWRRQQEGLALLRNRRD